MFTSTVPARIVSLMCPQLAPSRPCPRTQVFAAGTPGFRAGLETDRLGLGPGVGGVCRAPSLPSAAGTPPAAPVWESGPAAAPTDDTYTSAVSAIGPGGMHPPPRPTPRQRSCRPRRGHPGLHTRRHVVAGVRADRPQAAVTVEVIHDIVRETDPRCLDRILTNLVTNALRHGAEPVVVEVAGPNCGSATTAPASRPLLAHAPSGSVPAVMGSPPWPDHRHQAGRSDRGPPEMARPARGRRHRHRHPPAGHPGTALKTRSAQRGRASGPGAPP